MRERHDGLIINICSISGVRALSLGGIAYCASKFAMAALSTAVGNEEAPNGVRVTTIHPGEVNTPILEKRPTPVPEERKAIMVQPEDIGAMVVTIAQLPGHTHVPELIVKPLYQEFVGSPPLSRQSPRFFRRPSLSFASLLTPFWGTDRMHFAGANFTK